MQLAVWLISSEKKSNMGIFSIIVIIAVVIGLIISPSFRNGVVTLVTDIVTIAFGVSRVYAIVAGSVLILSVVLLIFALYMQNYALSGITFILGCFLFMIVWLPLGVVLKLFKVNSSVVPVAVRSFFAWFTFVAFLAMIYPELFTLKFVLAVIVLAIFFAALPAKIKFLEKILMPFVIVMILVIGWQHFFPEDFRSSVRYAQSWSKSFNSSKDRGSIGNEADAATSYAQLLKDVDVLYVKSNLLLNSDTSIHLKKGDIVRLVNHKQEVKIYDGQGFLQIQLKNKLGTYFKGPKYFIEAELVQIASPRDIIPEDDNLLPKNATSEIDEVTILGPGVYNFVMSAGETSKKFRILTNSFCITTDHNDQAVLLYENSVVLNLWELSKLPNNNELKIKSMVTQIVTIKVV